MTTEPKLKFDTVYEAEFVLKAFPTTAKLRRLMLLGVNLSNYSQKELGAFVGSSREKVNIAMRKMGISPKVWKRVYTENENHEMAGGGG